MASIVGFGPADSGSTPDRTIQKTTFLLFYFFYVYFSINLIIKRMR